MSAVTRVLRVCLAGCFALCGCTAPQASNDSSGETQDLVKMLLIGGLQQQLTDPELLTGAHRALIKGHREESAVVPGLSYHWAWFAPPLTTHSTVYSVVAARNDNVHLIRDPTDWSRAVGEWRPATREQMRRACVELARVAGAGARSELKGIELEEARFEIEAMPLELRALATRLFSDSTVIRQPSSDDNRWIAEVWLFETGRSARYRCGFPISRHDVAQLWVIDSVQGLGWFPLNPPIVIPDTGD